MLYGTQETYDMLQELIKFKSLLNDWERGFIEDMTLGIDSREDIQYLISGAREKIAEIYDVRIRGLR